MLPSAAAEAQSKPRPQKNTDMEEKVKDVPLETSVMMETIKPVLAPLTNLDRDFYTIRINTWKRNEQLILSLDHHSQCPGVALIQVI
eukprot:4107935-Ditylum_brightwellii.AAC.1